MPRIMKIFGRKQGNDTASTDTHLDPLPGFNPPGGARVSSPPVSPALSDEDLFGDGDTDDDDEPGLLRRIPRVSTPAAPPAPHAGRDEAGPETPVEAAPPSPIDTPRPHENAAPPPIQVPQPHEEGAATPIEMRQPPDSAAPVPLDQSEVAMPPVDVAQPDPTAAAAPAQIETAAPTPVDAAGTAGAGPVARPEDATARLPELAAAPAPADPAPAPLAAPAAPEPFMRAKIPAPIRPPSPLRNDEAGLYRTPFTASDSPDVSTRIVTNPTAMPPQASVPPAPPASYHDPSEGSVPVDPALLAASKTLIGGREADIVPLIPDTRVEVESQELDDEAVATATVEALRGACDVLVARVNRIVALSDGGQIIGGLIDVVSELDARYADDWGVVRKNGMREVLDQVYDMVPEGDRFILESLDTGRGKLSADEFVRDLRTVAESDRPRIVSEYASFLVFVTRCVLRQYLKPLEHDQMRLRDVSRRVDYLIDGVRDVLVNRINAGFRTG